MQSFRSMSRESNAGVEKEAETSSLQLFNEWLLLFPAAGTKHLYHTAQKHTTQLRRHSEARSQVQGSTGAASWWLRQYTRASPCNVSLIQSTNVKGLVQCPRISLRYFNWPLHERNKGYNDPQNLHLSQGKLDLKLAYKRGDNVSCMQFYSTDEWNIILVQIFRIF